MEYQLSFNDKFEICTIEVSGKHKRPEDSLTLQKVHLDISREHGITRFLVDMRQAEIVSTTLDTFEVGMVTEDVDRAIVNDRVAFVYSGDLTEHRFLETVANNRGYDLRVFNSMPEALRWLQENRS